MVLLNFPQLEWTFFYFAPANYHHLFMMHPEVGWVPKRVFLRATLTLPTSQDSVLAPSRDAAGSPALFLNSYLQFLACPWSWIVTLFLADVHQPVSRACCHHHPAWLSWLGHCGVAPHQCGHCPPAPWLPLAPSSLALRKPLACTAPWQWAQTFLNPELGTMETGPPAGPIAPAVLQTPTLHPELPSPHTAPNLPCWLSKDMRVSPSDVANTPCFTQGTTGISPAAPFTLRKGPKLGHLLYGANGCLWLSHKPLQWNKAQKRWVWMMCSQHSEKRVESDHSYGKGRWTWAGELD